MVRHSKNNTAAAAFTKAEYGKLKDVWGSKNVRVGAESMRRFDQCSICLNEAERPVTCDQGHLFCKECVLTSLLDQKRQLAELQRSLSQLEAQFERDRQQARQRAIEEVQKNFERVQSGVKQSTSRYDQTESSSRNLGKQRGDENERDVRRSQSPDRSTAQSLAGLSARIAAQTERAIDEAMTQLRHEQALAKRSKLAAYWLPSLTPSAHIGSEEALRQSEDMLAKSMHTRCFAGDESGHPMTTKTITDVSFVEDPDGTGSKAKLCPSCKKALNSVGRQYVLRRCGHVHCSTCFETLLKPALRAGQSDKGQRAACLECSKTVKDVEKDVILLVREGTGFSSAGNNEAKGHGVAFQG
jgi:nitric oxide synthase-interacting protein